MTRPKNIVDVVEQVSVVSGIHTKNWQTISPIFSNALQHKTIAARHHDDVRVSKRHRLELLNDFPRARISSINHYMNLKSFVRSVVVTSSARCGASGVERVALNIRLDFRRNQTVN